MKRLSIEVRGRTKNWSFTFEGDPRYLDEWLADGLNVSEILNEIPQGAVDAGLLRQWVAAQDSDCPIKGSGDL